MAERQQRIRTLQLEYSFDRLLQQKLLQAYQLLVPETSRQIDPDSITHEENTKSYDQK